MTNAESYRTYSLEKSKISFHIEQLSTALGFAQMLAWGCQLYVFSPLFQNALEDVVVKQWIISRAVKAIRQMDKSFPLLVPAEFSLKNRNECLDS